MPLRAHPLRGERRARPRLRMQLLDLHEERLVHWVVARSAFRLLTQSDNIAAYAFNTKTAKHLFCPNCGVASFYIPRSDLDAFDVNVRCLEGVNLSKLEYDYFDGRNWEKAFHEREQARAAK